MKHVQAVNKKWLLSGAQIALAGLMTACGNLEAQPINDIVDSQAVMTYNIPEAAGSFKAWSGGSFKAWSGGSYKAWSGGSYKAWSGGDAKSFIVPENVGPWDQVRLRQAQAIGTNLGQGVIIAIIDTGIEVNHPALAGSLTPSSTWKDFVDNDNNPNEMGALKDNAYGHGTLIAGIALQAAPNALILPIRALDRDGGGYTDGIAAAIKHAVTTGAKIINLSLGTSEFDCTIQKAVAALPAGVFVVMAAGNQGQPKLVYPASNAKQSPNSDPTVVSCLTPNQNAQFNIRSVGVGSVGAGDKLSSFSNYGEQLEMLAPGENIFGPIPGSNMGAWSGTSMAAGFVSGALALAKGQPLSPKINPDRLAVYVANSSDKIDAANPAYTGYLGFGRLNMETFMKKVVLGL